MSSAIKVSAELRSDEGKGASRRLRRAGKIPAVVYGGDRKPASLQLSHNEILRATEQEAFYTSVLQLVVGKKKQSVVIRDMQRHPWQQLIMHMDFMRISDTEELRMNIPLHFINESDAPAAREKGAVISHKKTDVLISCLPANLPEFIEVDLGSMDSGDIVHLSDLIIPEGVTLVDLQGEDAHDATVASVVHVGEEQEPEELDEDAAGEVPTIADGEKEESEESNESDD